MSGLREKSAVSYAQSAQSHFDERLREQVDVTKSSLADMHRHLQELTRHVETSDQNQAKAEAYVRE